jgi:hypothetical protein
VSSLPAAHPLDERLQFLAQTVAAESALLQSTDGRLFDVPMTSARAAALRSDLDLSERVDAFVARFGRLQDTVGDKLLPLLLQRLAEPLGPAIDNLLRAERLGLLDNADLWIETRQLRNLMVHEYIRDPAVLSAALQRGHDRVPLLTGAARQMIAAVSARLDSTSQEK